jgi:lipoyl(octanoyl) transferase
MGPHFHFKFHPLLSYEEGQKLQSEAHALVLTDPSQAHILGFEFKPVITLGKRGDLKKDILVDTKLPVQMIDRGGQATLHSPGQLVVYPVCNIKFIHQTPKTWVDLLLSTTFTSLQNLNSFNHSRLRKEKDGIYLGLDKVVSIGLRISKGISTHGLSINLNNDTELFRFIRACGASEHHVANLKHKGEIKDFFNQWCEEFCRGQKTLVEPSS